MASENEPTKLPFNGETGNVRNKGRRNGKGSNKTPQRGVGVEKLEKMRLEESLRSIHQQQQQQLLSYGAFQFPQQQQQQQQVMINNNNNVVGSGFSPFVGNKTGFGVGNSSSSSSNGYGWIFRNPFENSSKELSSIPNFNHHNQSLDLCLKKTRLNEENIMVRGENAKREIPLEVWKHHPVHHDFLGFMAQSAQPSVVSAYPTQNLHEKTRLNEENQMMRGTNARREMPLDVWNHHNFLGFMPQPQPQPSVFAFPTQNHDEVVAVHRRGDSSIGSGSRVFMEYEFFPEKDGKSTTLSAKDLFPTTTTNSLGFGSGEASSSITAVTSYGDTSTAYDSVDLSLRL